MTFIIVSVFAIYFLQYGVLYLFTPMSINFPIISKFVTGVYDDFNTYWYMDIGLQVVSVVLITAIFPPIELATLYLWLFVRRAYDQNRCCPKKVPETTKKKTLNAYKDLYCGLEFDIHY